MPPIEYIAPLAAGLIYAIGALFSKTALSGGVGVARTLLLYNWIMFLCFVPFIFLIREMPAWDQWQWPFLAGTLFFFGQITTFAAIRLGHVSVQTPVMGTKLLFVAAFAVLLGAEVVPARLWWGACLSMTGIFFLSWSKVEYRSNTWLAILIALMSAASFGLCDVLVVAHAKAFSITAFPVFMLGVNALLSLVVIPFFKEGYRVIPRKVWMPFIAGGVTFAIQAVILYTILSNYGKATAVNILYSSRGIWGVVFVWILGYWFTHTESKEAGSSIMLARLFGAALMLAAIFLVLK